MQNHQTLGNTLIQRVHGNTKVNEIGIKETAQIVANVL